MMAITDCRNQWVSDAFRATVANAARYEAAKMVVFGVAPSEIDIAQIQVKVQREWLEFCLPAGNA